MYNQSGQRAIKSNEVYNIHFLNCKYARDSLTQVLFANIHSVMIFVDMLKKSVLELSDYLIRRYGNIKKTTSELSKNCFEML